MKHLGNRRIDALRQSITALTRILSESKIEVTQRGMNASVISDLNGMPVRVNIPRMPDDASEDTILAINGFLDHEVAHLLFTDFKEFTRLKLVTNNSIVDHIYNIIEDARIEKLMIRRFKGSEAHLDAVLSLLIERDIDKAFVMADKSVELRVFESLFIPLIRSYAGQKIFVDYMADKLGLITNFLSCLEPLLKKVPHVQSTSDSYNLAIEIFEQIKNDHEEKEQKKENAGKKSHDQPEEDQPEEDQDEEDESEEDQDEEDQSEEDQDDEPEPFSLSITSSDFAKTISDEVTSGVDLKKYHVYSEDYDVLEVVNPNNYAKNPKVVTEMIDNVRHIIGPMQKSLERLILAKSLTRNLPGQESGRINPPSLYRLKTGSNKVFKRKEIALGKDVAVSIVIDLSGSMRGNKIKVATDSAFAISCVLDRLKVKHEVIGFTTVDISSTKGYEYRDMVKQSEREISNQTGELFRYARAEALKMSVLKSYEESLGITQKQRFGISRMSKLEMLENIDGESILAAAKRLSRQKSSGKKMIVLSDGAPAANRYDMLYENLSDTIDSIESSGIDVLGIGVETTSVKRFYKKNIVINNVGELPPILIRELRKILI